MLSTRWISTFLVGLFLLAGCGGGSNPAAPPDGWQTTDARWWAEGVDTSRAFPNLDSLTTMGVLDRRMQLEPGGTVSREQFNRAIKQSLLPLYRNNPMVVDSLFEEYATPQLEGVELGSDIVGERGQLKSEVLNKNQKTAYEAITEYFREPQREQSPDITWPDSLRSEEHTGIVSLQVHLAVEGEGDNAVARPDAVQIMSGPNPTLNRIAAKATTQATWEPAYLLANGSWTPTESWVRFDVPFQMR
jgi:hypothetical protein